MFQQVAHNPSQKSLGVTNGIAQLEFKDKEFKKLDDYQEIHRVLLSGNVKIFLDNQDKIKDFNFGGLTGNVFKKANITDIMVFSPFIFGCKYVVSESFINCLFDAKVPPTDYQLKSIQIEGVKSNHYLFFVPMIKSEEIDFKNSIIFEEKDYLIENKNYLNIKNIKEYRQEIVNGKFLSFEKITLDKKYGDKSVISIQGAVNLFFSNPLLEMIQLNDISNLLIPNRQIELALK